MSDEDPQLSLTALEKVCIGQAVNKKTQISYFVKTLN